jgi:hypothetical protein
VGACGGRLTELDDDGYRAKSHITDESILAPLNTSFTWGKESWNEKKSFSLKESRGIVLNRI